MTVSEIRIERQETKGRGGRRSKQEKVRYVCVADLEVIVPMLSKRCFEFDYIMMHTLRNLCVDIKLYQS